MLMNSKSDSKEEEYAIKIAFSLKNYFEKRIFRFLGNCNSLLDVYEKIIDSSLFKKSVLFRNCVYLSVIVLCARLDDFIEENI